MQFNIDKIDFFLETVRKYMVLRGNISQKDLAEQTGVGVSTVSRFLSQKTKDIDEHIVARIVAKLNIPLHEIIDFIVEDYTPKFQRLVKFYKESLDTDKIHDEGAEATQSVGAAGTAYKDVKATVSVGGGPKRTIPFSADEALTNNKVKQDMSIGEKLAQLSPRQKAYLTNFLDLDVEGRDLMVDLGNSLFQYFKQKGLEF